MKVVIVGGVAGGATAAARIRRLNEKAEIIIFERSGFVSYANCGLPYYIGGVIEDSKELTLQTPESFRARFNIKVRTNHEVKNIFPDEKKVLVENLLTGEEWKEPYDKLLLSPGARPVRPNLPGIESPRIFTLRTVEDTLRIHDFIKENKVKSAIMVGGGYIGIETAENLCGKGLKVTIVQRPDHVMNTLDQDMASLIHATLRKKGVDLRLKSNVTGFSEEKGKITALLEGGEGISADMVLLAVGVSPDNSLAKLAGLELGVKGSIIVNDRMETSVSDIYATGDAVQVKHFVTGEDSVIALAGPANKQGRIAADNICGSDSHYRGSLGSSIIKIFDLTVAGTGLTEKAAKAAGLMVDSVVLSPSSHADYYPGGKVMTMKVVYEKESCRLLGAQIIGIEGVDKRIDVLATAIHAGIRADKLKDLDLAYAPPFSSAKDPVNMAGFMIENLESGLFEQYHWHEMENLPKDGSVTFLDVRTVNEYAEGHIDGYKNIPLDDLRDRLNEIEISKPVYVLCQSGLRSYIACRVLSQNGFECYSFSGGYRFYDAVVGEKQCGEGSYPCGMEK